MPLTIEGPIQWNDGAEGTITQEEFRREDNRHAFNAILLISRPNDQKPVRGTLRLTAEAYDRLPGQNDDEKSHAVFAAFAARIRADGVEHGFHLGIDADDDGVAFYGMRGDETQ